MDFLDGLNKQQLEAVLCDSKHIRVIAGAGSGKTRVLTTRIVYLIQEKEVYPSQICAITFTNKAANEMKERLEKMEARASKTHISTIHALCVRILREDYQAADLIRNFTIIDSSDQNTILKEAYKNFDLDKNSLNYRVVLNYIGGNKGNGIGPKQAKQIALGNFDHMKMAQVYEYYQNRLDSLSAVDFDDLLLKVRDLLRHNETVRSKWQSRFHYVFVDEFQDIDPVQYQIIKDLVGRNNSLYVVGDPDQTIYTWRGADVNFVIDFEKLYPDSQTIFLNQNYRSTQAILDSANQLIANNKNRLEKELFTAKKDDWKVHYRLLDDAESEADQVAEKIIQLKDEDGSFFNTAVLYRSNYLSRALEKALVARHIPYVIYGGLRFYDHSEIKDFMSYLRMITHHDDLALMRSVQIPRRGIGDKSIERYFERAQERDMAIYEVMRDDVLNDEGGAKIRQYVNLIEGLKEFALDHDIEATMHYVLKQSGLLTYFEQKEEESRVENLKELVADAVYYQQNHEDPTLAEYVQMVSLYSDKNDVIAGDYVRLMTVHAAKGLEFDNVIITGLIDNVFPNKNSMIDLHEGVQEERRLMYVAMTRAKKKLFLTSHQGFSFVTGSYSKPSRFIKELDNGSLYYEHEPFKKEKQESFKDVYRSFEASVRNHDFKQGDLIVHDLFGEGIIIRKEGEILKIAFNYPHGTKSIVENYGGLRLKGDLS